MPQDVTNLQNIALRAIASAAGVQIEALTPDLDVFELGLDSLDFWAILMDIEDGVGAEVPADVLDRLTQFETELTVGDLLGILATWNVAVDSGAAQVP